MVSVIVHLQPSSARKPAQTYVFMPVRGLLGGKCDALSLYARLFPAFAATICDCLNGARYIFCKYQTNNLKREVLISLVPDNLLGFVVRLLCWKGNEWSRTPQNKALCELTCCWTSCNCVSCEPCIHRFFFSQKALTYAYNQSLHIRGLCRWSLPRN